MNLPTAQKRTSKHKKFVYVDVENGEVLKGPYKADEASYLNAIRNTTNIGILEDALELPMEQRASLPILREEVRDGKIYLVFKNVGRNEIKAGSVTCVTTRIDQDVPVLNRKSYVRRISDVEQGDFFNMTPDIAIPVLQHLYIRYILGVGDSGAHNILWREDSANQPKRIAGIDLEENRRPMVPSTRMDALFSKSSKYQRLFYQKFLPFIKVIDIEMLEKLKENFPDEAFSSRVHQYLGLA